MKPWDELDTRGRVARAEGVLKRQVEKWRHFRAHPDAYTAHDVGRMATRIANTMRLLYSLDGKWRDNGICAA